MLAPYIVWILMVSAAITAGGGLAAFLAPHFFLRLGFGVERPESASLFFVRHWGVLILALAALTLYGAYVSSVRTPVLVAGATGKFALGLLVFFGPVKRTSGMTAIAIVDGILAVLYLVYLAGL
jgi:hypothetical protein